jgi:hypothetical protein
MARAIPGTRQSRPVRAARWLLPAVSLALAAPAGAATPFRANEADLVHYAFATQLGSGIYSVDGRTLQIYRLPFGWQASEPSGGRPGVRFALPTTIGFYDFKAADVIESGLPDRLDTLSAAFGIELDFPLGRDWHLLPYAEAGRARDSGSAVNATIYSAELRARREFAHGDLDWRFGAGLVYAGIEFDGPAGNADFVKVELGVEGRRVTGPEWANGAIDAGTYVIAEWYADRPEEPVVRSEGPTVTPLQVEVGLTVGSRPQAKLWKIPLPRVGLAYRFGEGLSVYRVVFGAPF